MLQFKATLLKFGSQGEKTGWTYIEIPYEVSEKLKPGVKTAYRVKGKMDDYDFRQVSLVPMGGGKFILAINASMRKALRKIKGAVITVSIEADDSPVEIDQDFLQCLEDDPAAINFFNTLTNGHRKYFSNWIETAKTEQTKVKRIVMAVSGLSKGLDYVQILRANKISKD